MQAAAQSFGLDIMVLDASVENEIDAAFAALPRDNVDVLLINTDPFLVRTTGANRTACGASQNSYDLLLRDFVDVGVLMSYGPDIQNGYRIGRGLRWSRSRRRKGWRITGRAADPVRSGDQLANGQGAGSRDPREPARPRRRGDRVIELLSTHIAAPAQVPSWHVCDIGRLAPLVGVEADCGDAR